MATLLQNYPSGRLAKYLKGVFAVRFFGDYSFNPSEITLNSSATEENFNKLKPSLLRINGKRYYISSVPTVGQTKETTENPSKEYEFLPVYSSMGFGSPCVGRLVLTSSGAYVGSVNGFTISYNPRDIYDWVKKDGSTISFGMAIVEKKLSYWG